MRKKYLKIASSVFVSAFIVFTSAFAIVHAQTDDFVGDEDVMVGNENNDNDVLEPEIDMRIENEEQATTSEEEKYMEVQQQEDAAEQQSETAVQTISTAPEEAPDAGPAETIIIIAAITFGFLGAIIFLALVVHNRY